MARLCKLTMPLGGDLPPSEFRLFKAGRNETAKGVFVFDEQAAAEVLSAFEVEGVDIMIDLEHLSLDTESESYDPDARGWCQLAVRGGELWAVNVRWTREGAQRLTEKRQRYISPAVLRDPETGRVIRLVNIALTGMPATFQTPALVAAAKRYNGGSMLSPDIVKKLLVASESGSFDDLKKVVMELIAAAAGGEPATAADPPDDGAALADDPAEPAQKPKEPDAMSAAAQALSKAKALSDEDRATFEKLISALESATEDRETLSVRLKVFEDEKAAREAEERTKLVGELVRLSSETPATAWTGEGKDRKLVDRLANESLDSMRSRVAVLSKSAPRRVEPPKGDAGLTEAEQATLSKIKDEAKKAEYIRLRNLRRGTK